MYIIIFRSLIIRHLPVFSFYMARALNTVPVLVEVYREDDVWLGGLFLGDSFSGLCSIDICQCYEATIQCFRCLKLALWEKVPWLFTRSLLWHFWNYMICYLVLRVCLSYPLKLDTVCYEIEIRECGIQVDYFSIINYCVTRVWFMCICI